MKSCEEGGSYCAFHNEMTEIMDGIETQDWFLLYQEAHKKEEYVWNDETFDYDMMTTRKQHLDFDFLSEIIQREIFEIDKMTQNTRNSSESYLELLLSSLISFDYESYFYDSKIYEDYFNGQNTNYNHYVDKTKHKRDTNQMENGESNQHWNYSLTEYGEEAGSGETVNKEELTGTSEAEGIITEEGFMTVGEDTSNKAPEKTEHKSGEEDEHKDISEEHGYKHEEDNISNIIERGRRLVTILSKVLQAFESVSIGSKRKKRMFSRYEEEDCQLLRDLPHLIEEMKDGAVFSIAKMKKIQLLQKDTLDKIEMIRLNGLTNCAKDRYINFVFVTLKPAIESFDQFLRAKEFIDGLKYEADTHCELPHALNKFECTCECYKKKKLSIYNIFASLTLKNNKEFKLGGDILSWYYNNVMEGDPVLTDTSFKVGKDIIEEVINLDRDILSDISKKDVQIGLRDFITGLSQPIRAWKSGFDFPKLNSWSHEAKMEIFKLFNYDESLFFRGIIDVVMPDFQNVIKSPLCRNAEFNNLTNYCEIVKRLPDLKTTMSLMHLAKYPLEFRTNIEHQLHSFTKSKNPHPKLSYIPTCFFGGSAENFWSLREYSAADFLSNVSQKEFEFNLNVPKSDMYRYPQCKQFEQRPTDLGICHTFNGLDLNKVLKPSSWVSIFKETFNPHEAKTKEVLKSEGIDKEGGLVFSLDTMQSYLITKRKRETSIMGHLNSFWIKVHKPGDIPIMSDERSSWVKIESTSQDMVTKFISLKGEKVAHTETFEEIDRKTRKCLFPHEGNLQLFSFYSESNCRLECAWETAESVCGCRPWFIPSRNTSEVCFVLGNVCFHEIMEKVVRGEMNVTCDCEEDCIYSRYTIDVQDKLILERTSTDIWKHPLLGTTGLLTTDEKVGEEFGRRWFNMGKLFSIDNILYKIFMFRRVCER